MKSITLTLFLFIALSGCNSDKKQHPTETSKIKNEVIVLGTIHSGHLTQEEYNLDVLRSLVQKINPDFILAEIPPDRFPIALKQFKENDTITEPRVIRFPEYVDVIFPLSKTMHFEIIPTAGWTKPMADGRSKKLKEISEDPARAVEWEELNKASEKSDSLIKASGKEFDPLWINTDEYDDLSEIELSVYNKLFNDELGAGGWDNINVAHYSNIEKSLEEHKYKGKRFLITYGSGHKGWFLRQLRKREDIRLLQLSEVVK